ncbi:hypothetical protein P3S68_030012 [Capsicum galapagoense]
MILINKKSRGSTLFSESDILPTTNVGYSDGQMIINYTKSTSTPVATILFKGMRTGNKHAQTVAYFSSRGPSMQSQGILKPDIIGPGVNILAAWTTPVGGAITSATAVSLTFNILSGTSMSCPHLAGDETLKHADLLTLGSGHVNPSRAYDPRLIYDIQPEDYIPYLCGLSYTDNQVSAIVKKKVHCPSGIPRSELNYPSFYIPKESSGQTYTRTVTNVGEAIAA